MSILEEKNYENSTEKNVGQKFSWWVIFKGKKHIEGHWKDHTWMMHISNDKGIHS